MNQPGSVFSPDLFHSAFMYFQRLPQIEVDLVAVRSRLYSRHPVCQFLLPAATLKDEPNQILALDVVVVTAQLVREPVRATVIDSTRLDPKDQVFRAEHEVEELRIAHRLQCRFEDRDPAGIYVEGYAGN